MKRSEESPTIQKVYESIVADSKGRNADIARFLKNVNSIEGPFSYLVSSPWGSGKTFFIRSVELVLRAANPKLPEPIEGAHTNLREFTSIIGKMSYLPFYFNAWQNDFCDNPIAALLACMASNLGAYAIEGSDELVSSLTSACSTATLAYRTTVKPDASLTSARGLMEMYDAQKKLRKTIDSMALQSLSGMGDKIVVFIDELDRCRPDFAVKLLEQTKSLFESDRIIVVLSADLEQLSFALQGLYGQRYDSATFLERFYDDKFTLTAINQIEYMKELGLFEAVSYRFDSVVFDLAQKRNLTMRDCMRMQKLKDARNYCNNANRGADFAIIAMNNSILPVLVFIERENPVLWERIRTGKDTGAVYEIGKQSPNFIENVDMVISKAKIRKPDEPTKTTEDERRQFVNDLCAILFIDDYDDNRRKGAQNNELIRLWEFPNVGAFRTLDFNQANNHIIGE